VGGCLYEGAADEAWRARYLQRRLGAELTHTMAGPGVPPVLKNVNESTGTDTVVLLRCSADPGSPLGITRLAGRECCWRLSGRGCGVVRQSAAGPAGWQWGPPRITFALLGACRA